MPVNRTHRKVIDDRSRTSIPACHRWRRSIAGVSAAVLLLITVLGAGASTQNPAAAPPADTAAALVGNAENGKRLFVRDGCYQCHGFEGQGAANGVGARLAPDPMPLRALTNYIRKPTGVMPPYAASIVSDQEAADIHAYLKSRPRPVAIESVPTFKK